MKTLILLFACCAVSAFAGDKKKPKEPAPATPFEILQAHDAVREAQLFARVALIWQMQAERRVAETTAAEAAALAQGAKTLGCAKELDPETLVCKPPEAKAADPKPAK